MHLDRRVAPCPLCRETGTRPIETVRISDLEALYVSQFGTHVDYLFDAQELIFVGCPACGLRFFGSAVTGDEVFYNSLQGNEWYYMDSKYEFEFAARLVGDARVLDVGSGRGAYSSLLKNPTRYTGLDLSVNAQRLAKDMGIEVLNEDIASHARRMPDVYDAVCSFQSLEHVADPRGFLAAMVRCVRPGGRLIIAVPSEDSFVGMAVNSPLNMPPHHVTRWTDRALESVARLFGLEMELLHHEPLQDCHRDWCANVIVGKMLRGNDRLVDMHADNWLRSRATNWLSSLIRKRTGTAGWLFGHTVIAVYHKPVGHIPSGS